LPFTASISATSPEPSRIINYRADAGMPTQATSFQGSIKPAKRSRAGGGGMEQHRPTGLLRNHIGVYFTGKFTRKFRGNFDRLDGPKFDLVQWHDVVQIRRAMASAGKMILSCRPNHGDGDHSHGPVEMTILIAGAGIGGLTTALSLHQIRVPARVFESVKRVALLGVRINILPMRCAS
jgi:hypothetical protein